MARRAAVLLLCALALDVRLAAAEWRAAGDVVAVVKEASGASLTLTSGARGHVTFVAPDVVRVRVVPRGAPDRDWSYAVEAKERPAVAVAMKDGASLELTSPDGTRAVVRKRPFLVTVLDGAGRVVVEDDPARGTVFESDGAIETSKRRVHEEQYFGFGETALQGASRAEQSLVFWNTDTYAYPPGLDPLYQDIPFFIAVREGRAYGLFFDNTWRSSFDMGHTAPQRYTFGAAGGALDYYVFTGGETRSPAAVLSDYTALTGRAPLPPLWALGYQQSRYSYYPEARVRELASEFRQRRIPLDAIHLDIHYMDGYRVFTWDKERFPDAPGMLRDLRAQGVRVITIVDPGVKQDEGYEVYRDGHAKDVFCKTAQGDELHARVWPGICAFPDFTDPRARTWFGAQYAKLLDDGVSGIWNDMNEPGTFGPEGGLSTYHDPAWTFPPDARHAGDGDTGDHARYHNVYGMQMARSTFEGLRRLRPDARPFVLTRAGYAGVQRYSAVWTGDNQPTWAHLQLALDMLPSLGVSGVPFVGSDIGGFAGSTSAELYTRWLQAAALTPFCRTHSNDASAGREPWVFGPDYERVNRASIELRYRLLPYLYTVFEEHTRTGAPVMRPLWYEYPSDTRTLGSGAFTALEEYLVGRDLLVAPVVHEGAVARSVYFPKGDAWVDWRTGERHEGGTIADVAAPIDVLPLFLRAGASIPTQPVVQSTSEMVSAPITIVTATGADGSGRLYEDAGEGYAYQKGASSVLSVTQQGGVLRFTRTGSADVAHRVEAVELLGLSASPAAVTVDGQALTGAAYDAATRRLRIATPSGRVEAITVR